MRRRDSALGRAQFCGARAWIGRYLDLRRSYRTFGQNTKTWRGASWFRQMSRTAADRGSFDQEVLDDAVFQRMKRHHHQAATRLEHPLRRRQSLMQFVQLLIDENTHSLKRSR